MAMEILPHALGCFVCGVRNPLGLGLDLATDSRVVECRFCFRTEHCGFRGTIHGGLIATVLDEAMAWVIGVHARRFAYCAELNTRFLAPAAPSVELVARAEIVENKKGRLFLIRSELREATGRVLAEATGKYLPIPEARHTAMLADFAEDPSKWVGILGARPSSARECAVNEVKNYQINKS